MDAPAVGTEGFDDFPAKRKRPPREASRPVTIDGQAEATAGDTTASDTVSGVAGSGHTGSADTGSDGAGQPGRTAPPRRERNLPTADDLQRQAAEAVRRGRGPRERERTPLGARPQPIEEPGAALGRLVGPQRAKSLQRKLQDAGRAFQAERFGDTRANLRPVVKEAPELPDGRELLGLTLYRLGRWREAIDQLEAFRELTHSTEQHPVLMDCHRALGRWRDVDALWAELGTSSPSGELVTEGRIVLAGGQADQGDTSGAIRTLETGWKLPKRPGGHHLRRAYALADLYDRAGKTARARELFKWIAGHDPHFADVRSRVKSLS